MAELEGPLRARTTADAAAQTGVTVLDLEAMDDELLLSAVGAPDDSSAEQQQPATEPDLEMGGSGPSGSGVKMASGPIRSHNAWDRLPLLRRHQTGLSVCDTFTYRYSSGE